MTAHRSWIAPLLLGAALAAWRSARERRQSAERLAAATLEALLNAIDANDRVTGAHVRRVADYALVLADAAGLSPEAQRQVERVALFHDVGKIHEALFDIVHDDDALSPEEREAIATHPARGAEVLEPLCAFYPELPEGVVAHHERWDGQGYPKGLRGTAIPLAARIVAIADTFDAVTHARRYRQGSDAERGARVIDEGRGRQFDPELAALFLSAPVFARIRRHMRQLAAVDAPPRDAAADDRASEPRDDVAPAAARPRTRGGERRAQQRETTVPNVSFRWRGTAGAARGRSAAR